MENFIIILFVASFLGGLLYLVRPYFEKWSETKSHQLPSTFYGIKPKDLFKLEFEHLRLWDKDKLRKLINYAGQQCDESQDERWYKVFGNASGALYGYKPSPELLKKPLVKPLLEKDYLKLSKSQLTKWSVDELEYLIEVLKHKTNQNLFDPQKSLSVILAASEILSAKKSQAQATVC